MIKLLNLDLKISIIALNLVNPLMQLDQGDLGWVNINGLTKKISIIIIK